jgi:riboflavin kinase/FMN adenylyltransferase
LDFKKIKTIPLKIFRGLSEFKETKKSVVTVGTFDGVHIGHQKIIKKINANKKDANSVLLTFYPHPRMVLQDESNLKLLNTLEEKIELLKKAGLDCLVVEPFTKHFSKLSAFDFVKDILVNTLNIKKLVIGYDHRFGKNREGDFEQLEEYGEAFGFKLKEISAQDIENVAVSSTKIRKALQEGDVETANSYLGYNYLLTGKVVRGQGLGNKWNYPTINIQIANPYKLIPKNGVYIVSAQLRSSQFYGIMNIGYRPTVDGKSRTIEVHLLDFKADVYGDNIRVCMIQRLRDEQKFSSIDALVEQIKKDEQIAREIISNL